MKSDNEIIDKADKWKEEEFSLKRKALDLKDRRIRSLGKFVKICVVTLFFTSLVIGSGFGIKVFCASRSERLKVKDQRKAEEAKIISEEMENYEIAWVECVEKLSLNKCDLIRGMSFNRGFERGYEHRASGK